MEWPSYADLKYNVLFEFNGKYIITEIQFLVRNDEYYSILRYKDILHVLNINMSSITSGGKFASLVRAKPDNLEILKLLLNAGCNPCIQDKSEQKMNSIHRICEASKNDEFIENIKLIIIKTNYWYNLKQLKQALNTKDANGKIPIDYAKHKEKNNKAIQKSLAEI